jgi:hypothetical protein
LPDRPEFGDWDIHRRCSLSWDLIKDAFAESRFDVGLAQEIDSARSRSTMVRLSDGCFQKTVDYFVDRSFAPSFPVVMFIQTFEIWLVRLLGRSFDATRTLVFAHFCQSGFNYSARPGANEAPQRFQPPVTLNSLVSLGKPTPSCRSATSSR